MLACLQTVSYLCCRLPNRKQAIISVNTNNKMQINKEISTDARSFPEIWNSLDKEKQEVLMTRIYKKQCARCYQTVYYWRTGKKYPDNPIIRKTVASIVGTLINARVLPQTLFPTLKR